MLQRVFFALAGFAVLMASQPASAASTQPPQPVLGIEAASLSQEHLSLIHQAGAHWVRRNALLWSDIEPQEGDRNWAVVASLEKELRDASSKGLKTILVIRSAPPWAQKVEGVACGPYREDKLAAFGQFMRDVAVRYADPRFAITHFELGNEPDIDHRLVAADNIFGCWGDESDPYYGGGYYAKALQAAYPQIKRGNAKAQVLMGGLLLDCNPEMATRNAPCKSGLFLEGILKAGGGEHFDIVSVHAYDFWTGGIGNYANEKWRTSSATTGPSIIAKTKYIRRLLDRYGQAKPIMNTESAVLCWDCKTLPEAYTQTRAYYAARSFAAARADALTANIWYSLEGWFGTTLLNETGEANETMQAMTVAQTQMAGASSIRAIKRYRNARIYEYTNNGKRAWMVWSATDKDITMNLPELPASVIDVFGNPVDVAKTLVVNAKPLYVQW